MVTSADKAWDEVASDRRGTVTYLGVSLAVLALTAGAQRLGDRGFRRVLGDGSPMLAAAGASLLGLLLLSAMARRGRSAILGPRSGRGLLLSTGLACVFGLVVIGADLAIVFPRDINVPYPESLCFYPAIGFIVEILFHVLPVALLTLGRPSTWQGQPPRVRQAAVLLVAAIEPLYQLVVAPPGGPSAGGVAIFVGLHVYLVNLSQLLVFRTFGFIPMYALRLAYYAVWHLAWGYLRLRVLY